MCARKKKQQQQRQKYDQNNMSSRPLSTEQFSDDIKEKSFVHVFALKKMSENSIFTA